MEWDTHRQCSTAQRQGKTAYRWLGQSRERVEQPKAGVGYPDMGKDTPEMTGNYEKTLLHEVSETTGHHEQACKTYRKLNC